MAHYTLAASGMVIDSFQWLGGDLTDYTLPYWMRNLALTVPGDDTLCLPTYAGTMPARPTDWISKGPGGAIFIMSNLMFSNIFTATA